MASRAQKEAMSAVGLGVIEQTVAFGDFTDVAANGYIDLDEPLPQGAVVFGWRCRVLTGFTNDTTAVVEVGIEGTTAQFSADAAQSVLAAGIVAVASLAASSGDSAPAAKPIRVTVTGGSDFTAINAGEMIVTVWFFL